MINKRSIGHIAHMSNISYKKNTFTHDKYGWNWPSDSREDYFWINFVNVFSLCGYYLALEKRVALHLNKVESPLAREALCQVWLKLALWFWRRGFINFINVYHYLVIISPWKRAWPFIWKNVNPLHPNMLCAKFGWNWPSGSMQEDENVKSLQIDRWRDRRHAIWKAHLNFQLRWAKILRFHAKRHCSQTLNTNAGILGCSQSNTVLFFNHINLECSLSWSF